MLVILLCLIAGFGLLGCPSGGHLHLYHSESVYEEAPFQGAVGRLKDSTGTCPSSGVAPGWCTGGQFTQGLLDGTFGIAGQLDVDSENKFFYLTDVLNGRVMKYDFGGNFVGAIGALKGSTGTCPSTGKASGWCTGGEFEGGAEDGMFLHPSALALDVVNDRLYVSDAFTPAPRIQMFELSSGSFIGAIGGLAGSTGTCPSSGAASGWCTGGDFYPTGGDGGFYAPTGLALDSVHQILYVVDVSLGNIQKFDARTGAFIDRQEKEFSGAADVAVDVSRDRLYVADALNHRIQKFVLSTGEFLRAFGSSDSQPGFKDGLLNNPRGISLDLMNNVLYVADAGNHRLQRFHAETGEFLGAYGKTVFSEGTCPASGATQSWCSGGSFVGGAADGELSFPQDLQVVSEDHFLLVTDQGNNRVQKILLY